MWGSFWLSQGILYYLNVRLPSLCSPFVALTKSLEQAAGTVPPQSIHAHFPELAAWFIPLAAFTWSGVRSSSLLSCGRTTD